jgi:2-keto-4-pentenoate hydratase
MDSSTQREIAASLHDARGTGKPIPPITDSAADTTVEDAYLIQLELARQQAVSGELVRGYKVGLGSVAAQRQRGVTHPAFGHLTGGMFFAEHQPIGAEAFIQPRVEPGLAFVIGERLRGPGVTVADAVAAVSCVLPALEITDSRIRDWGGSALDSIADNMSCAGVVLGSTPRRLCDVDLRLAGCVLYRNGEVAYTGAGGVVLGAPINAVVWLANTAGSMGIVIEPGHIVLASSLTNAIEATPGDCVAATIAGLGGVTAVLG